MTDLAEWLQQHTEALIRSASAELSSDEKLRATVEESLAAFFDALQRAAKMRDNMMLYVVLIDWVESRSAPTDGENSGLLQVLTTLKHVTWKKIRELATASDAVELLIESENIFAQASTYLNRLETEVLLSNAKRELDDAQTTVRRLDKSKSDFIAVAAHELKTPLTLIEGYMNMLRGDFKEPEFPRAALMLNGMAGGTSRLREIVEDMIDVSMIDLRLLNLHYQPVWIHRLLDIIVYDMTNILKQRNITLDIKRNELAEKPTYADSERMYQVVSKVISNAIKYTPDGGTITVTSRDLPGFTDLQVSDTGIGIAPENLSRIFEKFSSMGEVALHSSGKTKFKGGGPGLGLAIAKGIMDAHGGSIWAESPGYDEKVMPGSIFHIMIPMRTAPPEDRMAELFKPAPTASSL